MTLTWRDFAVCREIGLELFYPETNEKPQDALAACARCRVRAQCLEAAMDEERGKSLAHRFGIRGGLTRGQRYRLARRRAQQQLKEVEAA